MDNGEKSFVENLGDHKDGQRILESTPLSEWEFEPLNETIKVLLEDDRSLTIESLSSDEQASLDVLVMGRDHGEPSFEGSLRTISEYRPDLIIYEESFSSQKDKDISDIINNVSLWQAQVIVSVPGKLPADRYTIYPHLRFAKANDINPLLAPMHDLGIRPILRAMGETDARLHSKSGLELYTQTVQLARDNATAEIEALMASESGKILAREEIMADDISCIIANFRRKLSAVTHPSLRTLIMCGSFHHLPLYEEALALGLKAKSLFVLDKEYSSTMAFEHLTAADRYLYKMVQKDRHAH